MPATMEKKGSTMNIDLRMSALAASEKQDKNVAVFGSFTVRSVRLDKTFTSPFSVWAKVKDGLIAYMQYREDTFGTGSTFRSSGTRAFQGNPNGSEVSVP
jgi:hypothetical protein